MERQLDGQTHSQMAKYIVRWIDNKWIDSQLDRQIVKTKKQIDGWIFKQLDSQSDGQYSLGNWID